MFTSPMPPITPDLARAWRVATSTRVVAPADRDGLAGTCASPPQMASPAGRRPRSNWPTRQQPPAPRGRRRRARLAVCPRQHRSRATETCMPMRRTACRGMSAGNRLVTRLLGDLEHQRLLAVASIPATLTSASVPQARSVSRLGWQPDSRRDRPCPSADWSRFAPANLRIGAGLASDNTAPFPRRLRRSPSDRGISKSTAWPPSCRRRTRRLLEAFVAKGVKKLQRARLARTSCGCSLPRSAKEVRQRIDRHVDAAHTESAQILRFL